MASRIDLLIRQSANTAESLQVFVSALGNQNAFVVPYPAKLQALQQGWRQRFLRHHDPAFNWGDGAAAVGSWSERLLQGLEQWLTEPEWQPLQTLLTQLPDMPLALRFEGPVDGLATLPWQALRLQRPILRVESQAPVALSKQARIRARKPRIVLLVGSEQGLNLDTEVGRLMQLKKDRRIDLRLLRGPSSSAPALRSALAETAGWDALLYLGHSSSGPDGGLLHLGDGSQLSGMALEKDWALAKSHGLRLLLFNSCSGLPLAQQAVRAGLDWTVCFLEPVPAKAAAIAFEALLQAMEVGCDLIGAVAAARNTLESSPDCEGCSLLLTAVAASGAAPFRLPLRRRRQFWLRLASSKRKQAIAAAAFVGVAFLMELTPYNFINTYLLNRRLDLQRTWRQGMHQPGPLPGDGISPIPVLLLDHSTIVELGADPSLDQTPRLALAELLRRTPVNHVPVVGIDVIFDDSLSYMHLGLQSPEGGYDFTAAIRMQQQRQTFELRDAEINKLALVISSQGSRKIVGGFSGPESAPNLNGASVNWAKASPLIQAGLKPFDLAVGTAAGGDGLLKPVPLHLIYPITSQNFSGALSRVKKPLLPADRVIDWSIDWAPWIRLIKSEELSGLRASMLLVGTGGYLNQKPVDLFAAPATVQNALMRGDQPIWAGRSREIPGVLVQAVLIQSLNLRHWLTPLSQTLCTAAGGALGIVVAALLEKRKDRLIALGIIALLACPFVLTLAIGPLLLVPILLPLLALSASTLCRDD